jgi:sulfur carrier protein ThiS adenylyltransferase
MLSNQEQLRYSRQIMLKQIGLQGQLKLSQAKVLIIGLGGLGNPVSMYLAAAGVGKLVIADGDEIDISNLQRQVLFNENDIGNNKADCVSDKLQQQNTDVNIEVIDEMLTPELCQYYLPQVDVVVDCTDNITTRYLLNHWCLRLKTPVIFGAATGFSGQQLVVDPRQADSACYQCLFPETTKPPTDNCQTLGILGPVLAIVAGMQALQTIKLLVDLPVQINQLNIFDGLTNQWQHLNLTKQPDCIACRQSDRSIAH